MDRDAAESTAATAAPPPQYYEVIHRDTTLDTERVVPICPHQSLSFNSARLLMFKARSRKHNNPYLIKQCHLPSCNRKPSCFLSEDQNGRFDFVLQRQIPIIAVRFHGSLQAATHEYITMRAVSQILNGLSLPMCQHLQCDSPDVLRALEPDCTITKVNSAYNRNWQEPCTCMASKHYHSCQLCIGDDLKTQFAFVSQADMTNNGGEFVLSLNIVTYHGSLDSTDPKWRSYATDINQANYVMREWNIWARLQEKMENALFDFSRQEAKAKSKQADDWRINRWLIGMRTRFIYRYLV